MTSSTLLADPPSNETIDVFYIKRDKQLTWRDLTSSSQEKLLEKTVRFQDAKIFFNELVSAEWPVATFLPLGVLLEEKELIIADPVQILNAYNVV